MSEEFDYTLVIDYEHCSYQDLRGILVILHHGSPSLCYPDIYQLAEWAIYLMHEASYNLGAPKYSRLISLLEDLKIVFRKIFEINRIKINREMIVLINHYMRTYLHIQDSPVASPVKSPSVNSPEIVVPTEEKDSFPKKMKKALRRKD